MSSAEFCLHLHAYSTAHRSTVKEDWAQELTRQTYTETKDKSRQLASVKTIGAYAPNIMQ
jgi:hypothetical protein